MSSDTFAVLPYEDSTGNGHHDLKNHARVQAFQVPLSQAELQIPRQGYDNIWANMNLGHLASRSDIATVASGSTSGDSDGNTVVQFSNEVDVLAEHSVVIMTADNIQRTLDGLAPSVVCEYLHHTTRMVSQQ